MRSVGKREIANKGMNFLIFPAMCENDTTFEHAYTRLKQGGLQLYLCARLQRIWLS